jgi:transposase
VGYLKEKEAHMETKEIFSAALGLTPPWQVTKLEFSVEGKRLDITIDFPRGSNFSCPECGLEGCKAYDTQVEEWRHMNFFQFAAYLHARVPRVECGKGCGVKKVEVPWSRPGSGFTLLFEALILALAREMPVAAIAALLGEHDTRLWRVIHHHVDQARNERDLSRVSHVGIDETASRRGHNYISLFYDLKEKRLIFGTDGKDSGTVRRFSEDLGQNRGDPKKVQRVCCDMSPAFISGVEQHLPNAEITFDRFHIMKIMQTAVDNVRRDEVYENDLLKKTRYIWLKNPCNLKEKQKETLYTLNRLNLKTARAYRIRLALQEFFHQPNREAGEAFLKRWYFWATHSRLDPVIEAAKTIKNHWNRIMNWFEACITMGLLEGVNSLIQAAKARARGYRTSKNMITMAYLIAGKLDFNLPT